MSMDVDRLGYLENKVTEIRDSIDDVWHESYNKRLHLLFSYVIELAYQKAKLSNDDRESIDEKLFHTQVMKLLSKSAIDEIGE